MITSIVKLGLICTDKATKLTGMIIRAVIDQDRSVSYLFQPRGQNDDGERLSVLVFTAMRIEKPEFIDLDAPVEILGTMVEDEASGIKGMANRLIYHESGCVHVEIQPLGKNKKGEPIPSLEVDLLRVKGPAVKKLTEKEKEAYKKEKPSPGTVRLVTRRAD